MDLIHFALQIAALVLLFIGAEFAYKEEYSRHGWVMVATITVTPLPFYHT